MGGERRRSWWGWGEEDAHLDAAALADLGRELGRRFGGPPRAPAQPVDPRRSTLPAPRVRVPAALRPLVVEDPAERFRHSHGQAYRDVVRAFHGELDTLVDAVLRPRTEDEVGAVLEWCRDTGVACIPWGGGTSVVGGVTPPVELPAISLDLGALDRVREVDTTSAAAYIEAGATGPAIDRQLRPYGFALRHYPQSWEFSTLGGWLATRAGGHYATLLTHIDELTEAITAITPVGRWVARRLPASGAGPSPDRLLLGSEGALGVITAAWVRIQPRPRFRARASIGFPTLSAGLEAVRALAQSGLYPANCRLLDATEAQLNGVATDRTVLVLGFESADHPLGPWIERAVELCRDHGGGPLDGPTLEEGDRTGTATGAAGSWRAAFLRAPYLRDALVALGMVVETFETAVTWDRCAALIDTVVAATTDAAVEVCGAALVTVRVTHAYPDGCAPYFTVIAPGERGREVAAWDHIKAAASEAVLGAGGTITHHHAVGRDHVPWYRREVPAPFLRALEAAKAAVDPDGVCNPGVLGLGSRRGAASP